MRLTTGKRQLTKLNSQSSKIAVIQTVICLFSHVRVAHVKTFSFHHVKSWRFPPCPCAWVLELASSKCSWPHEGIQSWQHMTTTDWVWQTHTNMLTDSWAQMSTEDEMWVILNSLIFLHGLGLHDSWNWQWQNRHQFKAPQCHRRILWPHQLLHYTWWL